MKRKLLSVLLTLCLAFSLLPTAALADGEGTQTNDVAQIGSTGYATLAGAVENAKTGDTIVMQSATDISATGLRITSGKDITLDLNGYEIKAANTGAGNIKVYGKLTLKDSTDTSENGEGQGKITTVTKTYIRNQADQPIIYAVNGDFVMQSGLIDTATGITNNSDNGQFGVGVQNETGDASVTIEGGKIKAGWYAVAGNGTLLNHDGNITVNGGILESTTDYAIYHPQAGTTTINGGVIYGQAGGIQINRGTLVVNKGTVISKGIGSTGSWGDGTGGTNNAAIHANAKYGDVSVSIKDGKVTAEGNAVTIEQGTAHTATIAISGGTFSSDVSAYCEKNYYTERNEDNTYTVKSMKDVAVAKIGDTYYKTLAKAVAAADNATVTLLKNTTEDITIASDKTVTLDLAGHKLTNVSGHTITNNGTLFVTGNGTVDNIAHGKGALYNNTGATATLNGGTFTRSAEKGTASPDSANGNSWYTVKNYGTMTINSNVTITNTGSHSSAVANGWFDVSKAGSNGEPIYTTNAVLTINGGNISGGKITVKNDDYGTLTITGGSISQPLNGLYCIYNANVTAISGGNVNGPVGNYNGTSTEADQGKFSITGGYFTSDPSAYLAASHYVWASDKDGYAYMVKDAVPTSPEQEITVIDKTDATVNNDIAVADKAAISGVISKANVDGVAEAVTPAKKADIVSKSNANPGDNDKVEIEVAVKVVAKTADLAKGQLTFEASPVATVKVDGTATGRTVPVTNDMLNGQPITVKLPLPTVGGKLFTPEQIKHISSDGSVEYFLKTAKRGAKTFEIKDDCAVFKITKFSTFELSGTVTYVEPSYSSGSSSSDPTYSVSTPSKTEHGTVTVSPKSASKGDTVTVTVKPDSGYVLETLTVTDKNGNELTLKDKGDGKYTFTMPAGKVEVKATFMEDNSMLNFFYDVPNNAYFYEAVKWAVKNGITTGVGNDLFAPEQPCTRAQIVTFLWRAAGSPEPKGAASGMSDVVSGSYYEKAVAWAIENGITTGTTTTMFSPNVTCTRAQAVTFLARALKAKAASAAEFSDVPTGSYFADAVAWAAANGVTEGIGGGLFGSDNDCTRGQIVTFLYRAYNK